MSIARVGIAITAPDPDIDVGVRVRERPTGVGVCGAPPPRVRMAVGMILMLAGRRHPLEGAARQTEIGMVATPGGRVRVRVRTTARLIPLTPSAIDCPRQR